MIKVVHFVYILNCIDYKGKNYYYRGYSNNIVRRYMEHRKMHCTYTRRYKGQVQIIYLEEIFDRNADLEKARAIKREKQIKNWSRKKVEKTVKIKKKQLERLIEKYFPPNIYIPS